MLGKETTPAPPQEENHPAYGGRKIPLPWRGAEGGVVSEQVYFLEMVVNMYETLLLISQAVKSGVPLSSAIRLTVGERGHTAFLRLADLLDKGLEPKVAATKSGLPIPVVELLDAALTSDDFAETFDELTKLEISRALTIHKVAQALAYPFLLFVSSNFILAALFIITVPRFEEIFVSFETELPAMTLWILEYSRIARDPAMWMGLAVFLVTLWIAVKILFPRFWFCIPVFGDIGRSLYMAKMLRRMAGLMLRNVPLPEALEQCGKTMRNSAFRRDCRNAAASARNGMLLPEITIRYYWLFPTWLAPMIAAENMRESLSRSLRRAAETVEQEKDVAILFLQTLSMPLFIVFMFSTIGFIIIALFLPLIKLITTLSA